MWNIRALPEDVLPIKNLVVLYNDKISFMFPEISMTITIRHAALYYVFDTLFETIFNFAEKVENPWGNKDRNDKSEMLQKPQKATEEDLYY